MLILAATPIGNLADASKRLRETLATAEVIAAEDTRKTKQLLQLLEINTTAKLVPLHDHNEKDKAAQLAEQARAQDVVLVSDAGMPTVSDPGYRVVAYAVLHEVPVTVVPGPSAPITALALSGMATDRFAFEGFLPRKQGELRKKLQALAADQRTLIFFESPRRIADSVIAIAEIFGADRRVAVCRELTKMHEEVIRLEAAALVDYLRSRELKGEIVLVIEGAAAPPIDADDALQQVVARVQAGQRLKDAAREIAQQNGLKPRELYEKAIAARSENAAA